MFLMTFVNDRSEAQTWTYPDDSSLNTRSTYLDVRKGEFLKIDRASIRIANFAQDGENEVGEAEVYTPCGDLAATHRYVFIVGDKDGNNQIKFGNPPQTLTVVSGSPHESSGYMYYEPPGYSGDRCWVYKRPIKRPIKSGKKWSCDESARYWNLLLHPNPKKPDDGVGMREREFEFFAIGFDWDQDGNLFSFARKEDTWGPGPESVPDPAGHFSDPTTFVPKVYKEGGQYHTHFDFPPGATRFLSKGDSTLFLKSDQRTLVRLASENGRLLKFTKSSDGAYRESPNGDNVKALEEYVKASVDATDGNYVEIVGGEYLNMHTGSFPYPDELIGMVRCIYAYWHRDGSVELRNKNIYEGPAPRQNSPVQEPDPPQQDPPQQDPPQQDPPQQNSPPENPPPENPPPENPPPQNSPPQNSPPENPPPQNSPQNSPQQDPPPQNSPPQNSPQQDPPQQDPPPENSPQNSPQNPPKMVYLSRMDSLLVNTVMYPDTLTVKISYPGRVRGLTICYDSTVLEIHRVSSSMKFGDSRRIYEEQGKMVHEYSLASIPSDVYQVVHVDIVDTTSYSALVDFIIKDNAADTTYILWTNALPISASIVSPAVLVPEPEEPVQDHVTITGKEDHSVEIIGLMVPDTAVEIFVRLEHNPKEAVFLRFEESKLVTGSTIVISEDLTSIGLSYRTKEQENITLGTIYYLPLVALRDSFETKLKKVSIVHKDGMSEVRSPDYGIYLTRDILSCDFDGDGTVGILDFELFTEAWGKSKEDSEWTEGRVYAQYDLDGNGQIDLQDFAFFQRAFDK